MVLTRRRRGDREKVDQRDAKVHKEGERRKWVGRWREDDKLKSGKSEGRWKGYTSGMKG